MVQSESHSPACIFAIAHGSDKQYELLCTHMGYLLGRTIAWQPTYMLGAHYVRELDALFIAEFHCAIVGDGHTLNLEHHIVDLQGFCCRRQGVNLEHQAA